MYARVIQGLIISADVIDLIIIRDLELRQVRAVGLKVWAPLCNWPKEIIDRILLQSK